MGTIDNDIPVFARQSGERRPQSLTGTGEGSISRIVLRATLVVATILLGLIAGFFYAYACSVMIGLERADDRTFIVTMQEINASVRNAWFAPSFFGSLILTGIAAVVSAVRRDRVPLRWTLAALALYMAAFTITMGISVPLNNELAAAGPPDAILDLAAVRDAYEGS